MAYTNTRHAKQLFLHGNGDGKRVVDVAKLRELTGVHPETIRRYLPEWEKELEELLVNSSDCGISLRLSNDTINTHNSNMSFLKKQMAQAKDELNALDNVTEKLGQWMDKFDGDEDDKRMALHIFDAWQRASGSKASLRSQFLHLQKQWTGYSGLLEMKDISLTREKEIAKGKAKLELKAAEAQPIQRDVNPLSAFARGAVEISDED